MRSILMSIRPQFCNLIFDEDKLIELRRTRPRNILAPFKVFVYETMAKLEEPWMDEDGHMIWRGSGRIIGEFVCNWIYRLDCDSNGIFDHYSVDQIGLHIYAYEYLDMFPDGPFAPMSKTCVTKCEFLEYADGKQVYGWGIEKPKRYKTPIDLSAFGKKRAPQSWCYMEVEK